MDVEDIKFQDVFYDDLSDAPSDDSTGFGDSCEVRCGYKEMISPHEDHRFLSEKETGRYADEIFTMYFDDNHPGFVSQDNWSSDDVPPTLEAFEGHPGLTVPENKSVTPGSISSLIFGHGLFEMMTKETNLYFSQIPKEKLSEEDEDWVNITVKEMKLFVGLVVLMGCQQNRGIKRFWSRNPLLQHSIFSEMMTLQRFHQIMRFWHFNDNTKMPQNSGRLHKIQPIVEYLTEKFRTVYKPKQQLVMTESVLPWDGVLEHDVYHYSDLRNFGLIIRKVCESESGYVCNLEIFTGNDGKHIDSVLSVVRPYFGVWHHIYQNCYHSSISNAEIHLANKTRVTGRIRCNKSIPDCLEKAERKLKKGECAFRRKGDVMVMIWKRKRPERYVSTVYGSKLRSFTRKIDGVVQTIRKPESIVKYKQYTRKEYDADHQIRYFPITREKIKWSKKIICYLMNIGIFNAFIMHQSVSETKMKYEYFVLALVKEWMEYEDDYESSEDDSECSSSDSDI